MHNFDRPDFPEAATDAERTMPGRRERKEPGRYMAGELILGRYKVLAELGQGGMGVVYRCFDETAGIEIALKALPPELSHNSLEMEDVKENFQLVEKLHHPNIAIVKNLERDPATGDYYLIMECVNGENLRSFLRARRKSGGLTLADALPILRQVAEALDYAHAEKIIHRDIKPGNIMIDSAGKVKVLDFGLAAQIHTSLTRVSMAYHGTSGTGPYMAPEQWKGQRQDEAADQYALAVMAYEMLAGNLPFDSPDAAVLQQAVLTQEAKAVPALPLHAVNALRIAMAKAPEERFASCTDFVAALGGKKIKAPKGFRSHRQARIVVALVLILAMLGSGGIILYRVSRERAEAEQRRIEAARQTELVQRQQEETERQAPPAAASRSGEFDSIAKFFAFLPDTIAEVDGEIITKDDFLTELDQVSAKKEMMALFPQQSKEQLNQLAKKLISAMVDRKISRILVEKAGFTPSEELARKALLQQIDALPEEQKKQLADMLKKQNTTIAEWVENMARKPDIQLGSAITEWSQKLKTQIAISDEEAIKYKGGKNNLDFVDSAHILIVPDKNDKDGQKARQRANELLARIRNGADFGQIAREESNCPSGSQNGELGKALRGTLVPEYFDAAFKLNPGEVSDVVKTQFGYHIIRLNSKGRESIAEIKDEMRQQRLEKEISAKINEQKKISRIKMTDF